MATENSSGTLVRADHPASILDALDVAAHSAASYHRTTRPAPKPARRVIERFPAGEPRGSWPAEEFAQGLRRDGRSVDVFMDLATDSYLVVEGAS